MRMAKASRLGLVLLGTFLLTSSAGFSQIVDLVGDMDEFGFNGPVPCQFFDNSGPGDLGIFDRELTSGDEVDAWTHDFTSDPEFLTCRVESVTIEIREYFSDTAVGGSTISIDGTVTDFPVNGVSQCSGVPIVQSFTFTGVDAAFAADGMIDLIMSENGDDIALDWSQVTVQCAAIAPSTPPAGLIALLVLLMGAGALLVWRRGRARGSAPA